MNEKLGKIQQDILKIMQDRKVWYPNCGWVWSNRSHTIRLMESLVKKGYLIKESDRPKYRYNAIEGKK